VVTAVAMNLEPLITIGLAVILLGERVSAVQLGGAALVVAAIAIMRRQDGTVPAREAPFTPTGVPRARLP
jgi:drug/metabolite transporter (DMT)-like permease